MTKLVALLALAGAIAAAVYFWRKNEESWESMWDSTKDATSEWGRTVAHEASKTADNVAEAADTVTNEASNLADE